MQITVNGQARQAQAGATLLGLLQELKLNPQTTVVELNKAIVQRERYGETVLQEGDRLELVRLVGGG